MSNKYPFTKQDGLKNCACACIQMIVKFYGGYISMTELELKLETDRTGTSAYKIIDVLNDIGFKSEGYRAELSQFKEINSFPLIAHVVIDNKYNHFLVVYKVSNNKVIIADPSSKVKTITLEEFSSIWTGIIITMYPIKTIPYNEETNLKRYLLDSLLKYKKEMIYMTLISLFYMLFTVFSSFGIKYFFESIEKKVSYLLILFLVFLITTIFKILSSYYRNELLLFLNKKIDITMNMDIYKKIINLPYQYFRNRTSGEIVSKVLDLSKIRDLINNLILIVLFDVPLIIISGIVLLIISKKLFIYSLGIFIIYIIIFLLSRKLISHKTDDSLSSKADMSSYLVESISGFESIKNLGLEDKSSITYDNKYAYYLKRIIDLDRFINFQTLFKNINDEIGSLIIIFVGIILVSKGNIKLSDLLVFNSLSVFFYSPMRNILGLDIVIEQAKIAYKKAYELIQIKDKKGLKLSNLNNINLNNLSFSFKDNIILKNISLSIKKGEKVLITGKSGAGKSTLLKLLMKYYDIDRNMIKYNKNDINDIGDINNNISYISQNETLFTDSIYNNINLFNRNIDTFSEVVTMCKVDEIISNSSLGYNTILEENGFNISGGQKQRIVLARALLSNYDLLLVDEGLNQVDVSLEREILKRIFKKYNDKTMIFVSHRLENLDLYNRFIEIENGRIIKDVKRV